MFSEFLKIIKVCSIDKLFIISAYVIHVIDYVIDVLLNNLLIACFDLHLPLANSC